MKYKQSRYNLIKQYGKEYLFYNLASSQIAVLDEKTYGVYQNCDTLSNGDDFTNHTLRSLYDVGFIVESNKNEIAFVNARRHSMIYYNTHEKCFMILPTTDCNARCFYCYQGDWHPQVMTEETAHEVVEFIKKSVPGGDKLHIAWFGGEPLYNYNVAKIINDALKEYFGDKYHSTMTSNGSLITQPLAKELRENWNLDGIQITIDNLFEKYERTKAYIDNSKFENVIDAVAYCLANDISVVTRINVDKTNINDVEELYSFLINKFGDYDKFKIYMQPLCEENVQCFNNILYGEKDYPVVLKKFLEIQHRNLKHQNISKYMCAQKNCACFAQSIHGLVIAPDGKLYKCQHIHEEDCIGDIQNGIVFNDTLKYYLDPNVDEVCEECKFLPICQGGCINFRKYSLAVGSRCSQMKYDFETRLDIIYSLYNDKSKKEVPENDNAHKDE